jgi:hypothetical protein
MFIVTKVHPGLIYRLKNPFAVPPHARATAIHLRQSQPDGACGPHCVFMALIALGVVSRAWVTHVKWSDQKGPRGRAWRAAVKAFFTGLRRTTCCGCCSRSSGGRARVAVVAAWAPRAVKRR